MRQSMHVHELRKGDRIEFSAGAGPPGRHVVLTAWGVTGINGPIEPWMVATRDANGKVHNFTFDPRTTVTCHERAL